MGTRVGIQILSMGIGNSLRKLGRFLDECEGDGRVSSVEFAETADSVSDGILAAEVELTLSTRSSDEAVEISLRHTSIDADGRLRLGFETPRPVVPTTGHDVELDFGSATVHPDGTVEVTLSAYVPTDASPAEDASQDPRPEKRPAGTARAADGASDSTVTWRDRDVPPFEDREFLAEVYESCETFAEMSEALGMDVTAETVRRYMIDHDIHEPRSYDITEDDDEDAGSTDEDAGATDGDAGATDGDDDLQTSVVLADGIGLPEDVTIDAIVETVRESKTIYEVKDDIGIEREDALEMLQELDLLEFVVGRLATEAEREVSREVVVERLRENAEPRVQHPQ